MKDKTEYGNWVSITMIKSLFFITIIFILLSIVSFLPIQIISESSSNSKLIVRSVLIIISIFMIMFSSYMCICQHLYSYSGGQVSSKILDYIVEHIKVKEKGKVLDIGCGSGALTIKIAKKFNTSSVIGIDYWGAMWDFAKEQCEHNAKVENVEKRITFLKGDAANLPFENESFDSIVSNFVFHEVRSVKDKKLVVREALRVLKKGGTFAFHDLFYNESLYGDINKFVSDLKKEGINEINIIDTRKLSFIPRILKTPIMLNDIALVYGKK